MDAVPLWNDYLIHRVCHMCVTLMEAMMVANTQGKDSVAPWNNSVAPLKSLAFRLGAAAPLTRCFPALFSFFLELFNKQQGRLLELQILGQGKHA